MVDTTIYLLLIINFLFFLFLSFYFSGIEAGFLSINREQFLVDLKQGKKLTNKIEGLVKNISLVLTVALLGNNLSNIALVIVSKRLWNRFFDQDFELSYIFISTLFLVVVGEIIPKIIFRKLPSNIFYRLASILFVFYRLFSPIIKVMTKFTDPIVNRVFSTSVDELTRKDLRNLVEDGQEQGVLKDREKLFIENFSNFSNTRVQEIMTPLVDVFMVSQNQDLLSYFDSIKDIDVDMVPVYDKRIDNIVGFVSITQVYFSQKKKLIAKKFIKKCSYVPESVTLEKILENFKMFTDIPLVVIDEHGGCCGIIYPENLLDNIFGFSYDPKIEHEKSLIHKVKNGVYRIDPSFDLDNFSRLFKDEITKDGFETLGGLINHLEGKVPKVGSIVKFKKYSFKIIRADKTAINEIELSF